MMATMDTMIGSHDGGGGWTADWTLGRRKGGRRRSAEAQVKASPLPAYLPPDKVLDKQEEDGREEERCA